MNGGQVLHVVWKYADSVDSVWTCRDAAEQRVVEINKEEGYDTAFKSTYYANKPDGYVVNLDA
jgi:hypothetical protein